MGSASSNTSDSIIIDTKIQKEINKEEIQSHDTPTILNETEIIEEQNLIKSSQSDEYENSSADNEKVESLKTTCKIEEESHIVGSEDNRNVILESVTTQILHNTEEEQSSKIKRDLI